MRKEQKQTPAIHMLTYLATAITTSTPDDAEQLLAMYVMLQNAMIPKDPAAAFQRAFQNAQQAYSLLTNFMESKDFQRKEDLRFAAYHQVQLIGKELPFLTAHTLHPENFPYVTKEQVEGEKGIFAMQRIMDAKDIITLNAQFRSASPSAVSSKTVETKATRTKVPLESFPEPMTLSGRSSRRGSKLSLGNQSEEIFDILGEQGAEAREVYTLQSFTVRVDSVPAMITEIRRLFRDEIQPAANMKAVDDKRAKMIPALEQLQSILSVVFDLQLDRGAQEFQEIFNEDFNGLTASERFDFMQALYYLNVHAKNLPLVAVAPGCQLTESEMKDAAFFNRARHMTFRTPESFNSVLTSSKENQPGILTVLANVAASATNLSDNTEYLVQAAKQCYQLQLAYYSPAMRSRQSEANFEALTTLRNFVNQQAVYDLVDEHLSEKESAIFFEVGFSDEKKKPKNRDQASKQAASYLSKKQKTLTIAPVESQEKAQERKSTGIFGSRLGSLIPEFGSHRVSVSSASSVPKPSSDNSASASTKTSTSAPKTSTAASEEKTPSKRESQPFDLNSLLNSTTRTSKSGSSNSSSSEKVSFDENANDYELAYKALEAAYKEALDAAALKFQGTRRSKTKTPEFDRFEVFMNFVELYRVYQEKVASMGNWRDVKGEKAEKSLEGRMRNIKIVEKFFNTQFGAAMNRLNESILDFTAKVNATLGGPSGNEKLKIDKKMNMAVIASLEFTGGLELTNPKKGAADQKEQFADKVVSAACDIAFLDGFIKAFPSIADEVNTHSKEKQKPTNGQTLLKSKFILSSFAKVLDQLPQQKSWGWGAAKDHPYQGKFTALYPVIFPTEQQMEDKDLIEGMFPPPSSRPDSAEKSSTGTAEEIFKTVILPGVNPNPANKKEALMNNPEVALEVYKAFLALSYQHADELSSGQVTIGKSTYSWTAEKGGILNQTAHFALNPGFVAKFVEKYEMMPPKKVFELAGLRVNHDSTNGLHYLYAEQEGEKPAPCQVTTKPSEDNVFAPELFSHVHQPLRVSDSDSDDDENFEISLSQHTGNKKQGHDDPFVMTSSTTGSHSASGGQTVETKSGSSSRSQEEPEVPEMPEIFKLGKGSALDKMILAVKTAFEASDENKLLKATKALHLHFTEMHNAYNFYHSKGEAGKRQTITLDANMTVVEAFLSQPRLRDEIFRLKYDTGETSLPSITKKEGEKDVVDVARVGRILSENSRYQVTAPESTVAFETTTPTKQVPVDSDDDDDLAAILGGGTPTSSNAPSPMPLSSSVSTSNPLMGGSVLLSQTSPGPGPSLFGSHSPYTGSNATATKAKPSSTGQNNFFSEDSGGYMEELLKQEKQEKEETFDEEFPAKDEETTTTTTAAVIDTNISTTTTSSNPHSLMSPLPSPTVTKEEKEKTSSTSKSKGSSSDKEEKTEESSQDNQKQF